MSCKLCTHGRKMNKKNVDVEIIIRFEPEWKTLGCAKMTMFWKQQCIIWSFSSETGFTLLENKLLYYVEKLYCFFFHK